MVLPLVGRALAGRVITGAGASRARGIVSGFTVHVEGFRELEQNLKALPKATAKNVAKRTLLRAAQPFIEQARATAPRGPEKPGNRPHLADSIEISTKLSARQRRLAAKEARQAGGKAFTEIYAGAKALPHAHLVEYGTFKMAPRPFMRPAWDANKMTALEIIRTELGNEIMKAAKRMEAKLRRAAAKARKR